MPYANGSLAPANFPGGDSNQVFSNVGGQIAGQPVLQTIYDLAPWNVMREVKARHSMAPSFRMLVKAFGTEFSRGVAAPTTGHYEEDWNDSLVGIGSIVTPAGGAGQNMVVALAADNMFNTAVTVGGAARQGSMPQENERLLLPNGTLAFIVSKDVTTNPHRLTLRPANSSENLNDSVTAGEEYMVVDNAWGEGTALPKGKLQRIYEYSNTFQIIKGAFGSTGSALTTEFFPIFKQNGENIAMILKDQTMMEYEKKTSNALLFGQQMNNITSTDSKTGYDVAVQGTEGLLKFATTSGYTSTYTPGSYSLQDFTSVARIMEQERLGTRTIVTWDGFDIYAEREDVLANQFSNTLMPAMISGWANQSGWNVPNDGWQPGEDADFVAWLGFKGVHMRGYNFIFRMLHEFNEAIGAGAEAYDYSQWSIFMPLGNTIDQKTKQPVANFGYEWKQLGNYKREAVIANIAGVGVAGSNGYFPIDHAASQYDYFECGIVSEIAFHAACGNRIVVQRPV